MFEGKPVGFYLKKVVGKIAKLLEIANTELLSDRVPKTNLGRASDINQQSAQKEIIEKYKHKKGLEVMQYSTIIGAIPPKPMVKRTYPTISSVHQVKTATNYIKTILLVENSTGNYAVFNGNRNDYKELIKFTDPLPTFTTPKSST